MAELAFRGDFPVVAKRMMTPAGWYLGFRCKLCDTRFAILDDPTSTGTLKLAGDATFATACPGCGAEGTYSVDELMNFQATTGGMNLPE